MSMIIDSGFLTAAFALVVTLFLATLAVHGLTNRGEVHPAVVAVYMLVFVGLTISFGIAYSSVPIAAEDSGPALTLIGIPVVMYLIVIWGELYVVWVLAREVRADALARTAADNRVAKERMIAWTRFSARPKIVRGYLAITGAKPPVPES